MAAFLWPYGKCLKCHKRGECKDSQAKIISCIENGYPDFAPQTNYDRLINSSMEELAAMKKICRVSSAEDLDECEKWRFPDGSPDCYSCALDWLKQEANG